jgi:hypothetical protein
MARILECVKWHLNISPSFDVMLLLDRFICQKSLPAGIAIAMCAPISYRGGKYGKHIYS